MSATEIVEQFRKLPPEEQRAVLEQIREDFDGELTPEEIAELDRRAEYALKNPGSGKPIDEVSEEIRKRLLAKK